MRRSPLTAILALVLLAATARHARAGLVVVDVCVGGCDDTTTRLMNMVRSVIASDVKRAGLIVEPPAVIAQLGETLPLLALTDATPSTAELTTHLEAGIADWTAGRNEEAAATLATQIELAHANPELVVSDPQLRNLVRRAQYAHVVSLARLHRLDDAKRAVADMVRALPEPTIYALGGPELDTVSKLEREDLEAQGRGSLIVQVDDPTARIYVDEADQPAIAMLTATRLPGPCRVLIEDARGHKLHYAISVPPHGEIHLAIDWQHDLVIAASPRRVGLDFATTADRAREGAYARELAAMARSSHAIVIGTLQWHGSLAIIGTIYQRDPPAVVRAGVVPVGGDELGAVHRLVSFLFSPTVPAPRVVRLAAPPWELRSVVAEPARVRWPFVVTGVGVVTALAVGVHYGVDGSTPLVQGLGYGLASVGLAVGIATAGIYLSGAGSPNATTAIVTPLRSGAFAAVGWSF